jgi:hypothetical protein
MFREKINYLTANLTFSVFSFSILGWEMFEILLFQRGAGVRSHFMTTLMGSIISVIALRRCQAWWPGFASADSGVQVSRRRYRFGTIFSCLALGGLGAVLGLATRSGTSLYFVLCAWGLCIFPWSRIRFCLRHFFLSNILLAFGAGAGVLSGQAGSDLFSYLFDAWVLWALAASLVLATYQKPVATKVESEETVLRSNDEASVRS